MKSRYLEDDLKDLYINQKLSTDEIGKILGYSGGYTRKLIKQYGIKKRTRSQTAAMFNKKGKSHYNYKNSICKCIDCGKNLERYGVVKRCWTCWNSFRKANIRHNYCIDCNKEIELVSTRCLKCSAHFTSGEKSPNYKGGTIDLIGQIRSCWQYRNWRWKILKRDGYSCQVSGKKEDLIVHHKIPMRSILKMYNIKTQKEALKCKLLWDVNWGIVLNANIHRKLGNI